MNGTITKNRAGRPNFMGITSQKLSTLAGIHGCLFQSLKPMPKIGLRSTTAVPYSQINRRL